MGRERDEDEDGSRAGKREGMREGEEPVREDDLHLENRETGTTTLVDQRLADTKSIALSCPGENKHQLRGNDTTVCEMLSQF